MAAALALGSLPYPDSNGLTQRDRDYFRMVRTENGLSDLVVVAKEERRNGGEGGGGVQLEQVQINQRSAREEATPMPRPPQRNEGEGIQGVIYAYSVFASGNDNIYLILNLLKPTE